MKHLILFSIFIFINVLPFYGVDIIKGFVFDENNNELIGANVKWADNAVGTITNEKGEFSLDIISGNRILIASYVGYSSDSIEISDLREPVQFNLKENVELQEVVVTHHRASTISSRFTPLQTQKITKDELFRAACCNLAESFETNPSVDVAYTDAATGARQIRLLGLAGTYVQMLTENYPNFRGVASPYGLDYVPGPWLESIMISKGTSSVKNGYEAIAGQINVEFKKPKADADIVAVNLFAGDNGRYEFNADGTALLNEKLSTTILAHFSSEEKEHDGNDDGFLDTPLKRQFNLMNRWEYKTNRYIAQFGARYLNEERTGGQISKLNIPSDSIYEINLKTNRLELFSKNGLMLDLEKNESIALIVSGSYHEQNSNYGFRPYNVYQTNLYMSLMYEKDFSAEHKFSSGLSFNYDKYDENYILSLNSKNSSDHKYTETEENISGAYIQYTFNKDDKLVILGGIRADYSNLYDFFITPRIHIKYNFTDWMHLRASAGKGFRTTQILPENNFYMASSRKINLPDKSDQEEAWNYGANLSFYIPVGNKDLTINTEWYYTDFQKQIVADMDSDPYSISFYNLDGKSYSSTFQIEASYSFFRGFTLTSAYRITDVKTTYNGVRKKKPFVNDYKGLVTASYQTPLRKWQFDLTSQFNGGGRLPEPDKINPLWDDRFDAFTIMNAQVTKFFRTWSVYLGSENLLDFTQDNPIIDSQNPWGEKFDSSIVWGPLHGRKFYVGLRWNIPRI